MTNSAVLQRWKTLNSRYLSYLFSACLLIAVVLTFIMASTSSFDRHPDELHHFLAAAYYTEHFLPPEIGDAAVSNTYSVWGVSYLNYHWIEYFTLGKLSWFLSFFAGQHVAARLANVLLFALLGVWLALRSRADNGIALFASFLLITPQVWYVFSYVNNDAFAMLIAMLAAYQIAAPDSLFFRFLDGREFARGIRGGVWFGILLGILSVCKPNYWIFLLFAGIWLLFTFPINSLTLRKFSFIVLVAACIFTFRIGLDLYVNGETNFAGASYVNYFFGGFETKQNKLLVYQEQVAAPEFKPSTLEKNLNSSPPTVKMKAKGVSAFQMLSEWKWHKLSFESFVGVYGYMNIWSPPWYYAVMLILYAAFAFYVIWQVLFSGRNARSMLHLLVTAFGIISTIFISFYLSWNYAFQAQGRYLFPIIPMAAVFVYSKRSVLDNSVLAVFFTLSFLLSVYSFVFIGLLEINN